jgi:hypothetical protein
MDEQGRNVDCGGENPQANRKGHGEGGTCTAPDTTEPIATRDLGR